MHFRMAIRNRDSFFHGLVESELVRLAIRKEHGVFVPLAATSEAIARRRGLEPETPTGEAPEFQDLEPKTSTVGYSLQDAEHRYQTEILRIFAETEFRDEDLPPRWTQALRQVLQEHVSKGSALAWSFFGKESMLWPLVEHRLGEREAWERVGKFVFDVARGPYVTFLPDTLNVSATYSHEDKLGVDLFRKRYALSEKQLAKITLKKPRPNLADTVAGLAKLDVDDVLRLRKSDALAAYEAESRQVGQEAGSIDVALNALLEYRREVEDAIFGALGRKSSSGTEVSESYVASALANESGLRKELFAWTRFLVDTALDIPTFGIFSKLSFGFDRVQAWRGRDPETKALHRGAELEKAASLRKEEAFAKLLPQGTIDDEAVIDQGIRDLCVSLSDPAQ
jgi:hypothetical protein